MVRRAFGTPQMSFITHLNFMSTQDDPQRNRRSSSEVNNEVAGPGKIPADSHSWQRGFANVWMLVGAAPAGLAIGYFIDRSALRLPSAMVKRAMRLLVLFAPVDEFGR